MSSFARIAGPPCRRYLLPHLQKVGIAAWVGHIRRGKTDGRRAWRCLPFGHSLREFAIQHQAGIDCEIFITSYHVLNKLYAFLHRSAATPLGSWIDYVVDHDSNIQQAAIMKKGKFG